MTQVILIWCSLHMEIMQLAIMDDHFGSHSLAYLCDYFINVSLPHQHVYSIRIKTMSLFAHCCFAMFHTMPTRQQSLNNYLGRKRREQRHIIAYFGSNLCFYPLPLFQIQPLAVLLCHRIPQVLLVLKEGFSPIILYLPGIHITQVISLILFNGTGQS